MVICNVDKFVELMKRVESYDTFPWDNVAFHCGTTEEDVSQFSLALEMIYEGETGSVDYDSTETFPSLGSFEQDCAYIAQLLTYNLTWDETPQGYSYWYTWYQRLKTIGEGLSVEKREEPEEFPEFII